MERLTDLGRALAQLRSLLGLSIEACASRIGTTTERLAAAEQGDIDRAVLQGIAGLYALDEEQLREGMVMPVEGALGSTVFLLHGAYQDFDAQDLGVLDRAMRTARSMTALSASSDGGERLQRRIQFMPVAPAGPQPRDAARQGYKLARWVRTKLDLGGEPIEDMRALLEEQLGIAVVVDDIISTGLRAASILDAHRAAAAAVLASDDPARRKNPTLARVYLAHELGHLLFDPGAPGSVCLALDDRLDDRANRPAVGVSPTALLESRAKGFAAELLIPLDGVTALFGAPTTLVSSLDHARAMVTEVCDRFSTSWDIATYHLRNLGFIQQELTLDLLHVRPLSSPVRAATSLPSTGATSLFLSDLLASLATQLVPKPSIGELSSPSVDVAPNPPWYVAAAQRAAATALDDLVSRALVGASRAAERDREIEAVDVLVECFDDLFLAREFEAARRALARLDPQKLPPKVLTGVLMVTAHAREELGCARSEFFARVQSALTETWRLDPEAIDAVVRRLE